MTRFYCIVIPFVLIITSHTVNSFFTADVTSVNVIRNITCKLNGSTSDNDYQLCAIRIYSDTASNSSIYNGLRYSNTFRQFINDKCSNWPKTDGKIADIGSAGCTPTLSYETFSIVQLCICATDNCNQNLSSCINSNTLNTVNSSLSDIIPNLNSTVQCINASDTSNVCNEHDYINKSVCQNYVQKYSVLCVVSLIADSLTQTSLIYENYAAYLDEKIYEVKSKPYTQAGSPFNETNTTIYSSYYNNDERIVQQCICTSYSGCNQNINTCLTQTVSQIETTDSTPSGISTTPPTTIFVASTSISTQYTSITTDFNSVSTGFTSIITYSTGISTDSTSISTASASAATGSSATTIPSDSATTPIFISSVTSASSTTTTMLSDASTTPVVAPPNTPSSNTQVSISTGDYGLGRAATAGIACGIIFSALIFAGEIAFFKLIYPKLTGNVPSRAARYQV